MKKKNLNSLILNKKSISNLNNKLKGGVVGDEPPVEKETEQFFCTALGCDSMVVFCESVDLPCNSKPCW
jgi:hypothetical protein